MPVANMQSTNLPEVLDAEALFKQYHVGEIERILHKLEGERKRVQQDLSLLVGQHYTKIIEASNAVDEMKSSASVMDELFSQLTSMSTSVKEEMRNVSIASEPQEDVSCELYESVWNLIFDGNLPEAAMLLKERKDDFRFQSAIKCLNNESSRILSSNSDCPRLVKAVKAECILGNLEAFDVVKAHLDFTRQFLSPSPRNFVDKVCLIWECCNALNKADDDVLSLLNIVPIPEEQDDLLWSAMELSSSATTNPILNQYSTKLFTVWLRCLPQKTTTFSDLFDLAFKISSINSGFLIPEWQDLAREYFDYEAMLDPSAALILFPILGHVPVECEAASMESYLVPSSKCNLEKLTPL